MLFLIIIEILIIIILIVVIVIIHPRRRLCILDAAPTLSAYGSGPVKFFFVGACYVVLTMVALVLLDRALIISLDQLLLFFAQLRRIDILFGSVETLILYDLGIAS